MSETSRIILKGVVDRQEFQAATYLPSLIAVGIVILGAYLVLSLADACCIGSSKAPRLTAL